MKELHEIAKAYFAVASNDVKKEAQIFFNQMDKDIDNKVSLREFLEFMKKRGYHQFRSPDFFKELCRRDRENLEFMDVMTLYYIILSGRPFCDGCNKFIKDTYFCCIECFNSSKSNYCLCIKCYKTKKTDSHDHHQFLDNFTFLEIKRREALKRAAHSNQASSSHTKSSDRKNDGKTYLALVPTETKTTTKKKNDGKASLELVPIETETKTTTKKVSSSSTKSSDRKNDGKAYLAPVPTEPETKTKTTKASSSSTKTSGQKKDEKSSLAIVPAKAAGKSDKEIRRILKEMARIAFSSTLAAALHASALCTIM